ncbi:hypothetical protein DSM106972_030520 [Dulcicalothrix desertica PCC 7102]|uniref:Uncharacterized protein n=1 Tax=Dulcicalothrix desertica PCC 7102 TaxID=232991 RepID=A0A3S1J335_9CYAN|nr:hypothetical protein [Dulcicalothrix desertica]RUT06795.1 hypothetical protein DSM106972_030520 [Dulcicalothrix desertica PCC 7102]TWH50095.1 hypothetical protein CAL7102_04379 [Dulcicalothrix desertica PCC 7102]
MLNKSLMIVIVTGVALNMLVPRAFAQNARTLSTDQAPEYNQAGILTTQPATIDSKWGNRIEQTDTFNQSASSISIVREDQCRRIDAQEILNDPGSFFRECPTVEKTQTPELGEKLQYFTVPKLDSGVKLQITDF